MSQTLESKSCAQAFLLYIRNGSIFIRNTIVYKFSKMPQFQPSNYLYRSLSNRWQKWALLLFSKKILFVPLFIRVNGKFELDERIPLNIKMGMSNKEDDWFDIGLYAPCMRMCVHCCIHSSKFLIKFVINFVKGNRKSNG